MSVWAAVRLRDAGPVFHAKLADDVGELRVRQRVFVQGERIHDLATVVKFPVELKEWPGQPLQLLRAATAGDLAREREMREQSRTAIKYAKLEVRTLGLPIKIAEARYSLDGRSLAVFFSTEDRVDFRDLVRRLSERLNCRVELRQLNAREETRHTGGVGACGETLCCATWLTEFEPVSVRAAKEQCMSMSGDKLTGMCGKLKCCLNYELHVYKDLRKGLPKPRQWVRTDAGWARVVAIDVLKQSVVALTEEGQRWTVRRDEIRDVARQPGGPSIVAATAAGEPADDADEAGTDG